MSDKIKPSEVSSVLLEQLKGISGKAEFDEVGRSVMVWPVSMVCIMLKLTNCWNLRMARWLS